MNKKTIALAFLTANLIATASGSAGADVLRLAQGWYGGSSREYRDGDRDRHRPTWAVGTFHGRNGANGNE
jgi:hypothetical protein